ncbi:MAG: hypothetical protein UY77_C0030G0004 [Candidatus Uhrbacteria bacterium GW2011_GWA2_53_10]|uniref:Uncharacterized protein n=1 Tax=Candidatus Uhrbacteria bacterium GW2011_GWA2_53_10 TaxID=1618980 RepID=A0A0G2AI64_9BACT|nr:MAG: hypothetical protein UY77_C0030G0004 [Candidatus Uhrbacteria bacterium GW2011_GWA2_53_10]
MRRFLAVVMLSSLLVNCKRGPTIPENQRVLMGDARKALQQVAVKSPTARALLAFYDANAVAAKWEAHGVRVVHTPKQGKYFFVAVDPVLRELAKNGEVYAEFRCHPFPTLLLTNFASPEITKGFLLAHELQHVMDCLENGEPESQPLDPNWLIGEMRAYWVAAQVLNEWSGGAWENIAKASREQREVRALDRGLHPEAAVFGVSKEDLIACENLFHVHDPVSLGALAAQLNVDTLLTNIDVQMERYGLPEEEPPGRLGRGFACLLSDCNVVFR